MCNYLLYAERNVKIPSFALALPCPVEVSIPLVSGVLMLEIKPSNISNFINKNRYFVLCLGISQLNTSKMFQKKSWLKIIPEETLSLAYVPPIYQ